MRRWGIISEVEEQQLASQINVITARWHGAPTPWNDHWVHLVTSAERWEQNPESMQLLLDAIARDYARTGATDLADEIQVRNLLLAGELVEARRTDFATLYNPSGPHRVDTAYGYLTSFRTAGHATVWRSLPSWSSARRWLTDQAAATTADTSVDITITGPDPLSGAPVRPLMTGSGLSAQELGDRLRHLDELLGAVPVPVDSPAQSWLDDLRFDVLCDTYRDALIDHSNHWAVSRRYENYIRVDDLYVDIVDYAERAGLHRVTGAQDYVTEGPDVVETRLADIRRDVQRTDIDWTTPPRINTWLDEAVDDAQHHLDVITCGGIKLLYSDLPEAGRLVEIGFEQNRWYLQYVRASDDGRTVIRDNLPESFPSCDELINRTALFAPGPDRERASYGSFSDTIASQLRAFEGKLKQLEHDVATVRQLRDAVRTGEPVILRRHQSSARLAHPQTRSTMSRDANRIGPTETPECGPIPPTAQPDKRPRAKRRRPPDSGGSTHRRRL